MPKVGDAIRMVEKDGWHLARARGSHRHFKQAHKRGVVTIAGKASKDIAPGTWASIPKQAQLDTGGSQWLHGDHRENGQRLLGVPAGPSGCVAAAGTREETEALIQQAATSHLDMLRSNGEPVPEPLTTSRTVMV